jgi:AcrR family transcriptional regulator
VADGPQAPRRRVLDPRRDPIINAFVGVAAEDGFAGAVVGRVCERTGMSRRTFYKCFTNREDCLRAVLEEGKETAIEIMSKAFDREEHPNDGLRAAAAALLVFLDEEPRRARVLLVESLAAGQRTLEHRARILAELGELVLTRLPAKASPGSPPYAAQAAAGAVLALLHSRVVRGRPAQFIEMLGPIMGIIAFGRVQTPAVQREIERGDELARRITAGDPRWAPARPRRPGGDDPLPAILAGRSRRARECLFFLADHPDSSNRETAAAIGVALRNRTHAATEADVLGSSAPQPDRRPAPRAAPRRVSGSGGAGSGAEQRLKQRGSSVACGPMSSDPVFVSWTLHALDKARQLGFARGDVEDAVLDGHRQRLRNPGKAGWKVVGRRIVAVYEHPDDDDPLTARIVTVWRRR